MTATIEATDESLTGEPSPTDPPAEPPAPSRRVPTALLPWRDPHPRLGWLVTALVLVVASVTRFWALGSPPGGNVVPQKGMNFDEIYYATEAQELLRYGYEDNRGYMFIVHPPLGKWLIAFSEYLWDGGNQSQYLTNSLGWRIAPALFGTLGVVMLSRTVRRMMRSNLFGGIAGLLMSMEGVSLVLARTAILDIFLQTFIIASFGALRHRPREDACPPRRSARRRRRPRLRRPQPGPAPVAARRRRADRPGRCGEVDGAVVLHPVLDHVGGLGPRRAEVRGGAPSRPLVASSQRRPSIGALVALPLFAYLFCWIGWFTGENSWNRQWADTHSPSTHLSLLGVRFPFSWAWVPAPLRSLGQYHHDAYAFHEALDSGHPYQSNPWSWWVLGRPVAIYYSGSGKNCGASLCSREILLIGTPLMWWAFAPMVLWLAWYWFTTRDWRAGVVWVALGAGWLVWFQDLKRTMFLFYFAPVVPFLIIGLTLALGVMLGPALQRTGDAARFARDQRRRLWGMAGVGAYLGIVVADFVWMWPIFTGGLLTYAQYHAHMWLPSWV